MYDLLREVIETAEKMKVKDHKVFWLDDCIELELGDWSLYYYEDKKVTVIYRSGKTINNFILLKNGIKHILKNNRK